MIFFINPAKHAPGVENGPTQRTTSSHSFPILCVAMYRGPLYKSCQLNCRSTSRPPPPSRVPFSPALSVEFTTDKINEVNGTKARLSDYCQLCPWVHTGHTPGTSWEKHKMLQNHKTLIFQVLCVAMFSGLFYTCCQPSPFGKK